MVDEIRGIPRPIAYAPATPVSHAKDHEHSRQGRENGRGKDEQGTFSEKAVKAFEELKREVESANARLSAKGKRVGFRVTGRPSSPMIEVMVSDGAGAAIVTRRVPPAEMARWLFRIEAAEGALLDETL